MRSLTSTLYVSPRGLPQLISLKREYLLTPGIVELDRVLLHAALAQRRHAPDVEALILAVAGLLPLDLGRLAAHEVIVDVTGAAELQGWAAYGLARRGNVLDVDV